MKGEHFLFEKMIISMTICSNDGTIECSTYDEYKEQINKCFNNPSGNEIWCSHSNKEYPCISILVNGIQAVCNYFSENNEEMFASLGNIHTDGTVEFLDGQYTAAAYQVIKADEALECALKFYYSDLKPNCIKWEKL